MRLGIAIAVCAACGTRRPDPQPVTPPPVAPVDAGCVADPAALAAIGAARAADDGFAALAKARDVVAACASIEARKELAETLAYLWLAEDATAAFAGASVADIPVPPRDFDDATRAAARAEAERGAVAQTIGDFPSAVAHYERAYRLAGDPKQLAAIGRAYEASHQPALAARWYARALAVAEKRLGAPARPKLTTGYANDARALAFSPDGKYLAAGAADNALRVWSFAAGAPVLEVDAFADEVAGVAFDAAGASVAAVSRDGHARVFDVASGDELLAVDWPAPMLAVAFVGTQFLATAGAGAGIALWDLRTGARTRVLAGRSGEIASLAVAPCGCRRACTSTLLAAGTALGTVELWEIAADGTATAARTVAAGPGAVRGLAWSADGARLAVAADRTRVLDACDAGWRKSWTLPGTGASAVAFLAKSGVVVDATVAGTGSTLRFTSIPALEPVAVPRTSPGAIHAIAPHPSVPEVVASDDRGVLRVVDEGAARTFADDRAVPRDFAVTPDGGTLVACGNDRAVTRWRLAAGTRATIATFDAPVTRCRLDRAGTRAIAVAGKLAKVFDVAGGGGELVLAHPCVPTSAALGRDRAFTACDGKLFVWDLAHGRIVATADAQVDALAVFPDGARVATGGPDKMIRMWDAELRPDGAPLVGFEQAVTALAVAPDGSALAGGGPDLGIVVFDLRTRTPRRLLGHQPLRGERGQLVVGGLAWAPDGKQLVSAGWDHTVRAWDLAAASPAGQVIAKFTSPALAASFRGDGATLFAAARDGRISVFRVTGEPRTYAPLAALYGAGDEWAVAATSGEVDASANGAAFVRWSVAGDGGRGVDFAHGVAWRRQVVPGLLARLLP